MSAIPNLPEGITNGDSSNADAAFRQSMNNKDAVQTNGETNGASNAAPWQLHDQPVENQRPLKVIVIGAGYSGIYLGIRLPERLRNCEIVIYEKNAGMGGTWYEVSCEVN
jgi:NADH dehydrogenase FAD-containing subunit